MRKLELFFVLVFFIAFQSLISAQNVSPQFSELKGMEDEQSNTHLLYRIYSYQHGLDYESGRNDIYNLVPGTSIDTIYFYDGYTCSPYMGWGETVIDYDFWDNDLTKFIYAGDHVNCFEPGPFISRFDSTLVYNDWLTYTQDIFISKQNDSLVFALPNLISYDGGFTWDTIQPGHQIVSVAAYDDQTYFSIDAPIGYSVIIFKSTDAGNSYSLVDTGGTDWGPKFYYDSDAHHIYRTFISYYPNRVLKVSANQGNAFTWQTLYETSNDFFVCLDESQSGAIYLADGKKIFFSNDYGSTFNLYKQLNSKIVGIYKKPSSDKLYAATKYRIYEITNDSISIVRSLPIPEELLAFYPLSIGNYWIYKVSDWSYPNYSEDTFTKKVISKETLSNNKKYFKIEEKYYNSSYSYFVYERVDSVNGLVYRFDNDCPNPDSEKVIDNFTAEVGDSLLIQKYTMCWDSILTLFSAEGSENIFNENRNYRTFEYNWLMGYTHKLVNGIGIYSVRNGYDFGETNYTLKGCVIDGILYGDTTFTDVEDKNKLPKEFSLSQNYPNPFNPSTRISWQSPVGSWQTLKVYDVLGNEVATLVDEYKPAGSYEIEFSVGQESIPVLTSGIYFYQLKTGDFVETKKMILLK